MFQLNNLFEQAITIWVSGGWAMIAIAIVSVVMFWFGLHIFVRLSDTGFSTVNEKMWRTWINHPEKRKGPIGELLDFVIGGNSLKDMAMFFDELRVTELVPFDRDLRIMKICVSIAPLLGLLGTVTGMLTTFDALASGEGGEKTMSMIAAGISEALITTETGLMVALVGLYFQYMLMRKFNSYKTFVEHLETVCMQKLYKNICMSLNTHVSELKGEKNGAV